MQKKLKRVHKGEAALYVTRAAALRKLGMSLAEFRRICILKGIYPRVPKRKFQGADKVYYSAKEIRHIRRDALCEIFRRNRLLEARARSAYFQDDELKARTLMDSKAPLDLAECLRSRYPSFAAALADFDDALSCIALFTYFTPQPEDDITADLLADCRLLLNLWYAFCLKSKCVNAVFASIKGLYFRTRLLGTDIVWLQPYNLPVHNAVEVDFKAMGTYLLLYTQLLRNGLYKLFKLAGFEFEPRFLDAKTPLSFLDVSIKPAATREAICDVDGNMHELFDEQSRAAANVFHGHVFYIGAENAVMQYLFFALKVCGADVVAFDRPRNTPSSQVDVLDVDSDKITMQITDLDGEPLNRFKSKLGALCDSRDFVQPQWIFDSINAKALEPTLSYEPGKTLKPHLSPFDPVDYAAVQAAATGDSATDTAAASDNEEDRRAVLMLSGRKRALYQKLKAQKQKEKEKLARLARKAKKLGTESAASAAVPS